MAVLLESTGSRYLRCGVQNSAFYSRDHRSSHFNDRDTKAEREKIPHRHERHLALAVTMFQLVL